MHKINNWFNLNEYDIRYNTRNSNYLTCVELTNGIYKFRMTKDQLQGKEKQFGITNDAYNMLHFQHINGSIYESLKGFCCDKSDR